MQKGDVDEAAKYYAAASKAFPSSGDTNASDAAAKTLLVGENGVLTLSRGEYVDALEQLYPYSATYWGDVAYIAERVLTVDELKTFVDTHKDTQFNPAVSDDSQSTPSTNPDEETSPESSDSENGPGPADRLRDLLARRLVRVGRYQEALNYAPALEPESSTPAAVPTVSPGGPAIAASQAPSSPTSGAVAKSKRHGRRNFLLEPEPPNDAIAEYVQALNEANTVRSNIDRARGWYRAAVLAGNFKSGNKIMGTEGTPDYFVQPALGGVAARSHFAPTIDSSAMVNGSVTMTAHRGRIFAITTYSSALTTRFMRPICFLRAHRRSPRSCVTQLCGSPTGCPVR